MKHEVRHQVALAGRVVDGATGAPIAGARVELATVPPGLKGLLDVHRAQHGRTWDRLDERADRTRTDAAGRFTFLDLPSGAYALAASLPGDSRRYGAAKGKATVKRNRAGDVATAWLELSLPATSVTGKVTGPGAKPVVLAAVQVKGGLERAYTDSQGKFLLAGLESGPRTLVVTARGFKPAEKDVALKDPGTAKTVNVALTPPSS